MDLTLNKIYTAITDISKYLRTNKSFKTFDVVYDFEEINENTISYKPKCNSVAFKNQGDEDILINNVFLLEVGSGLISFGTDMSHFDNSSYSFKFSGLGSNPKLSVVKRLIQNNESYDTTIRK